MYSKIALDLYKDLLSKVGMPVKFVPKQTTKQASFMDWLRKFKGPPSSVAPLSDEARAAFTSQINKQFSGSAGRKGSVFTDTKAIKDMLSDLYHQNVDPRHLAPGDLENLVRRFGGSMDPNMSYVNTDELISKIHELSPKHLNFDWRDNPWVPIAGTAAAMTIPAYYMGKRLQGGTNELDKLKYGLGGLGVGLATPFIYNTLKNKDLGSLAAFVPSTDTTQNAISDFTSI